MDENYFDDFDDDGEELSPRELDQATHVDQQSQPQSYFGQEWDNTDITVDDFVSEVVNSARESLGNHVSGYALDVATQWLRFASTQAAQNENPRHNYQIDISNFSDADKPILTGFLNVMAANRVSGDDVKRIIDWLKAEEQPKQTQHNREFTDAEYDAIDIEDRNTAEVILKERWGSMFYSNMRTIGQHLARLPRHEREMLQQAELSHGGQALNNPQILEQLLADAARNDHPVIAEIEKLERYMREDRKAYLKDTAAQARLRQLYQQRDGG